MRWLRASALVAALAGVSRGLGSLLLGPLLDTWHLLAAPAGQAAGATGTAALTTAITGFCAALLLLAWAWLVAAVSMCAWATLRSGPCGGGAVPVASALRPRVVRAVVTTVLGTGVLAAPTVHAHPVDAVGAPPDDPLGTPGAAVLPGGESGLLAGLPAPDRVTGAGPRPVGTSTQSPVRPVLVQPGDSLWSITAELLPADAATGAVARGWRLLHAANRDVVGSDPDLLHPGQSLRLSTALLDLMRSAHRSCDGPARP